MEMTLEASGCDQCAGPILFESVLFGIIISIYFLFNFCKLFSIFVFVTFLISQIS